MKVRILDHTEIRNGVKEITLFNVYTKEKIKLTLEGDSYRNFVKYVMYLWSNNQRSDEVVTKVVDNKNYYCFYRV